MKTQKRNKNKVVHVKGFGAILFWSVLTILSLCVFFICIVLPVLSFNKYFDYRNAKDMVSANRWLMAFCGSVLFDFLLIISNRAKKLYNIISAPTFWRTPTFLG